MKVRIGSSVLESEKRLEKPYIIAEAGVNHGGDINKAKLMIKQALEGGADAIKFQSYKAHLLASKNSPAYWDTTKEPTKSQYELFRKYDSFWKEEYIELADYTKDVGIDFLSTPFDFESADFLEPLVSAYKIASADITNLPFLRYVAKKDKPILLSTGASTVSEIWRAIETIENESNKGIVLLHCVLNYPTDYRDANLGMIADMREKFRGYIIGYSDHTLPEKIAEILPTAWLLGAQIIEKHFTFDKSLPGNDHYHAMDVTDLKKLTLFIEQEREIVGRTEKRYLDSELSARMYARRSLVAARFIPRGKKIEKEDIAIKRPGTGVSPYLYDEVIGSIAVREIEEDEILELGDFSCREKLK